jgi:hypothetical protein
MDGDETDEALMLKAKRPGFATEDISVELKDHTLIRKGERQHETEVKHGAHEHRGEDRPAPQPTDLGCTPVVVMLIFPWPLMGKLPLPEDLVRFQRHACC